jgi:hypothetical protein
MDWPTPRLCSAVEYIACGHGFGAAAGGAVTTCRRPDGIEDGPVEVREVDGSVTAQATCRDGVLAGPLYRWRGDAIAEVLPMRDGMPDGLYMRWVAGRVVEQLWFRDGSLASPRGTP